MSQPPAYDPTDPRYYDEKDLRSEVERIFGLCADKATSRRDSEQFFTRLPEQANQLRLSFGLCDSVNSALDVLQDGRGVEAIRSLGVL